MEGERERGSRDTRRGMRVKRKREIYRMRTGRAREGEEGGKRRERERE